MSGRKEEEALESAKHDNSNMKLSTNLSLGTEPYHPGSAHKREIFQSGFKEVGPCSPHLFSNQKKSLGRAGHSPFLPYRSPESIISRFMTDRQADVFDMFDYKRPHYDNILSAFGGFAEGSYTDQRTERRLNFKKDQDEPPVASFVFTSPNKKGREMGGDLRAVNSNQPGRERAPLRTPDREMSQNYMKHMESTAMDTSERKQLHKSSDYYFQRPYKMNLDADYEAAEYGDLRESLKVSKGLKTLSQRVKEIVCEKRKTTYKEVAAILIEETKIAVEVLSVVSGLTIGTRRTEHKAKSL